MDAREELRNTLCLLLIQHGVSDPDIEVDIALNDFEITKRVTDVAIRFEDKNAFYIQKFLASKIVNGCSQRTVEYYSKSMNFILQRINKPVEEITTDDIRLYLALRQKRDNVLKTTANNERRVISSFYAFLTEEEILGKNPVKKIKKIKETRKKKTAFTDMEIEKIRDTARNARERCIIEILLSTGCRVQELVEIKIEDIQDNKILVHGKGDKYRTVYLNAKAILWIEKYLSERKDDNPYLFCGGYGVNGGKARSNGNNGEWYKKKELVTPDTHVDKGSVEQMFRKLKKRGNIETSIYPHKFRRTCATLALRRGMPIVQVSKMLGHDSLETTQIYLDLNEQELEIAHRKYVI